jgi:hypothetical protein
MLTKTDLTQIKLLLVSNNSQLYKEFGEIKESIIEEIKDQIKYLPTREEYYNSMDKLMKEVMASRETQEIIGDKFSEQTDKLENHEERIENLETKIDLPA